MSKRVGFALVAALVCNKAPYCSRFTTKLAATINNEEWSRRDFVTASSLAAAMVQMDFLPGDAKAANAAGTTPLGVPPTIPFSTRRDYKHILLSNGLRVLLVSDKKTLIASAALSIGGAGQFQEDAEIGGLAHLTEHMVCSTSNLEDWVSDREGASNAFTAPNMVCYHFNIPPEYFSESLSRFSELFIQESVVKACRNDAILKREIRRVDSELDFGSDFNRAFYLIKSLVNKDHPFSRFTQGSYDSLERIPNKKGIDVAAKLVDFFKTRYLPSNAALVVICPYDVDLLEKWVAPFSSVLSRVDPASVAVVPEETMYPPPLVYGSKPAQFVLWHPKGDSPLTVNIEKLSMHWLLERSYERSGSVLTSTTVGFFISQLIDRRGPGSLYLFLLRRGWIPEGNQGLPRITFPIDVSGFQLMRLDIVLNIEGFANRSAVVAAVYNCLKAVVDITDESFNIPVDLLKQYVAMARLYGYNIAPRPPDVVELAVDAQTYGMGGSSGVGVPGIWPLLPPLDDPTILSDLRKAISEILTVMVDPKYAITILTASNKAILESRYSFVDDPIPPPLLSNRWKMEPISGARYLTNDMMSIYGYLEEWITNRFEEDVMRPPSYNPLIPSKLRPPRHIKEQVSSDGTRKLYYLDTEQDSIWREFVTKTLDGADKDPWKDRAVDQQISADWQLYQSSGAGLPLPMMPLEPTCRCSIVVQLLSSRTARASVDQAAFAQLWMLSFENAIMDLVSSPIIDWKPL
jgi:insulysin